MARVEKAKQQAGTVLRTAEIDRNTTETKIALKLTVEGQGRYTVSTGIRFFDHMLELFTRHGAFDLELQCKGDLDVDQHHTVEDVGIALGEAFDKALGDKRGILRAGYFVMPMDETLAVAAIDLSGRVACVVKTKVKKRLVGDLQSELVEDFFDGFARGARANVHLKTLYGRSNHHKIEALFKAFARALRVACSRDKQLGEMLPSTKGSSVIAVIDYKAGNLTSVMKALTALGAAAQITEDPAVVRAAERVVLPGVGHFQATARLRETGIDDSVREVIARGVPFLGICVGLQWLFEGSTEADTLPGLGVMRGSCARFPETHKVPHVGWNTLQPAPQSRLLAGLPVQTFVYYTHSYRAPLVDETVGVTEYAGPFSGAVERGNLFGVQFHPEKSGDAGLQVLRNFLAVPRC